MSTVHRVLAATDFSPAGHAAIARAGQLTRQFQCELTVLHATPDWTQFSRGAAAQHRHYEKITHNAEELMRDELTWLRTAFGLTRVRGEVQHETAARAITRMAEAVAADLVVIGATGEQLLFNGIPIMGGTALKVLANAPVPVLVVRTRESGAYQSTLVVVAQDLDAAGTLIQWALGFSASGPCHLVRTYDAPYAQRMRLSQLDDAEIGKAIEEQRRIAVKDCSTLMHQARPGQQLLTHLVQGAPAETVLGQIGSLAPQLVVVGQQTDQSRNNRGEWAADLGTRIAYHSLTDVLVVPC